MSSSIHLIYRLRVHWRTKLWLGALLTIVFCAGYFGIGYHPLRPPARLALTTIDRAVPFSPGWVWAYQSIYLLLPAAWLCETADQLRRYAAGFAIVILAGFGCFLLWPVAGPRPQEICTDSMYGLLVRYDTTLNSFPSLHMALATYSACVAVAITSASSRRLLAVLLLLWVGLIGYATLATKQHYWVDLPPGVFLGWLAQYVAWKDRRVKARLRALVDKRAV